MPRQTTNALTSGDEFADMRFLGEERDGCLVVKAHNLLNLDKS
jgi:hypothetical protein